MKIDFELLRDILITIEESPNSILPSSRHIVYENINASIVDYHIHILVSEDYIDAIDASSKDSPCLYLEIELTLKGKLLAEHIKNNSTWLKIKEYLRKNAIPLSFEAIKLAAEKLLL